jgi:hypothetical protein
LTVAEIHIPRRLRDKNFQRLFSLTARALESEAPRLDGLSFSEARREYARFTAEQAERCLENDASSAEAKKRLRESAFAFGQELRRDLGVRSAAEVMRAARVLYRLLGIEFQGSPSGVIVIRKCLFSSTYTSRTCGFISALDEGILAGLAGGGRLEFSERITEERPGCLARFEFPAGLR